MQFEKFTFKYLQDLQKNNNRDWFADQKEMYLKAQQNAKDVGRYLKSLLNELKEKHSLIGDVRGHGLFLGVELVRNLESLDPANKEADQIVNAMKEKRILISSDGPDHNIIKIKPPLVFNRENALFFTETLDEILS